MWRSRWRCVIKPAYSVSFLLSINIFVWQNVLYFPNDSSINQQRTEYLSYTLHPLGLRCVFPPTEERFSYLQRVLFLCIWFTVTNTKQTVSNETSFHLISTVWYHEKHDRLSQPNRAGIQFVAWGVIGLPLCATVMAPSTVCHHFLHKPLVYPLLINILPHMTPAVRKISSASEGTI